MKKNGFILLLISILLLCGAIVSTLYSVENSLPILTVEDPVLWQYDDVKYYKYFNPETLHFWEEWDSQSLKIIGSFYKVYYLEEQLIAYDYYLEVNFKTRRKVFDAQTLQLIFAIDYNEHQYEIAHYYYEDTRLIMSEYYEEGTGIIRREVYEYQLLRDEEGSYQDNQEPIYYLASMRIYNKKFEEEGLLLDFIYEFDPFGNLIKEEKYGLYQTLISETQYTYNENYDIECLWKTNHQQVVIEKICYEYNDFHYIVVERHYENAVGDDTDELHLSHFFEYEYNEEGDKILIRVRYPDSESTTTYVQDPMGNWVLQGESSANTWMY